MTRLILFTLLLATVVLADPNINSPHNDDDYDKVVRKLEFSYLPPNSSFVEGMEVTAVRHFIDDGDNDVRAYSRVRFMFDVPTSNIPFRPFLHFGSFRVFHGEVYDRTREMNIAVIFDELIEYSKSSGSNQSMGFVPGEDTVVKRISLRNLTWNSLVTANSTNSKGANIYKFSKSTVQSAPQIVFTVTHVDRDVNNTDSTLHRLRPHANKFESEVIGYPYSSNETSLALRYLVVSRHFHTWHDTKDADASGQHDPRHDPGVMVNSSADPLHTGYFTWSDVYDDFTGDGTRFKIRHFHYELTTSNADPETGLSLNTTDVDVDGDDLQVGAGDWTATIVWASFHGTQLPHIHWDPAASDQVLLEGTQDAETTVAPTSTPSSAATIVVSMLVLLAAALALML